MLISCVSAWSAYVCRVDGGRVLKLLLSSFSSTHTRPRSCDPCIRCWRSRFPRITLPCNYLGIIRGLPTLSLHNHNPQPLCLSLDLSFTSLVLTAPLLSLISAFCLFVWLTIFCAFHSFFPAPHALQSYAGLWGGSTAPKKNPLNHSFLSHVVRSNCQLISLNSVVVYPFRINNISISSISSLIWIQLKQPALLRAGANSLLMLVLLASM